MTDEFREHAQKEFARLLPQWQKVEKWIKQAEQVNNQAVIPAINELRYASRQLFNAQAIFAKEELNEGLKSSINRRLIIAEQYLYNSEHDIFDSIVGFYKKIIDKLDLEVGQTAVIEHYTRYPYLKESLKECDRLIADARHDYNCRRKNYDEIREKHFPLLTKEYEALLSAEVAARETQKRLAHDLKMAEGRVNILWWTSVSGWFVAILALIFAFFTWTTTYEDFCKKDNRFAKAICVIAQPSEPTANTLSTPSKPDATAPPKQP